MPRIVPDFSLPPEGRLFVYTFVTVVLSLCLAALRADQHLSTTVLERTGVGAGEIEISGWQQAEQPFTAPGGELSRAAFMFTPDPALAGATVYLSLFRLGDGGAQLVRRVSAPVPRARRPAWLQFIIPAVPTRPGEHYQCVVTLPGRPAAAGRGLRLHLVQDAAGGAGGAPPSQVSRTLAFRLSANGSLRALLSKARVRLLSFHGGGREPLCQWDLILPAAFLLCAAAVFSAALAALLSRPSRTDSR